MGDNSEDRAIEIEQKNKREFLEKKIGLPDSKVIEERNKLGLKIIIQNKK